MERVSVLPDGGLTLGRYRPDPDLADHVASYWTCEVRRLPATSRVVPDGLVDLTFDLAEPPRAWVAGPMRRPESYTHTRPTLLIGASLLPGAALPVLGVSVASLSADWSPLADLVGPVATELTGRLAAAGSIAARLALLDTFLAARLRDVRRDGRVSTAIGAILDRGGAVEVASVARRAAASPRNLARLFDEWVGLSPKLFARITRVQAVLRRLVEDPGADLATLAAELGFADHAHLTREVRALVGTAPSRLRIPADSFKPGPPRDP
ncbi:helix-turn-helix domain-containing protein [Couchioplanes azureus]|uniref:helix-turn-helix domain-containing protein n=1 Tax=Couchioplanes caeruleus TaxID=56438 RepID=UPI00166FEB88|nr:helix-turn-helix domain-containing protein [Couchioplanes caeruleus]GGQ55632.1 hypothetical protein GCM10010166_26160 [Couchioplanes caeruleus subsp. azureus]